jgi:hypothetical protein
MSTTAILPALNASSNTPTAPTDTSSAQGLNTMFMQLLMAQLKNQSPLSPMDPTQFVGQLAQFSELSAVNSIYTLLQKLVPAGSSPAPAGANSPPNTSSSAAGSRSFPFPVAPASATIPDFTSPALNPLTSKIQGGF